MEKSLSTNLPLNGQVWRRPVPVIGDTSTSAERASDVNGWAFTEEARESFYQIIGARRDIRKFRPDEISEEILLKILDAGHKAPSVGHSQPWRFIKITDPSIRQSAAVLADKERLRQASLLQPDSARRLLDLQLEGIREAPIGIVIACDRRTHATGVLGRATFPDADMWSAACAIENIWLAARAEGLGLGWVTLFKPEDLADLLHLPDGVETLGWLCLGWPDERPPTPGLERAGWSTRVPIQDVVFENRWPEDTQATPAPISHLRAPTQRDVVSARDVADPLLTTPSSLGLIDRAVDKIASLKNPHCNKAIALIVASDHKVTDFKVSAFLPSVTAEVSEATRSGQSIGASLASAAQVDCELFDAGVIGGSIDISSRGDLVNSPALNPSEVDLLIKQGISIAEKYSGQYGMIALGEIGIGNTTIASALSSALLNLDPKQTVGLGAGADSQIMKNKEDVITSALKRVGKINDPKHILSEFGGGEFAVMVGVIMGATSKKIAVVLDGLATSVAALIAVRIDSACQSVLIAGQRSREKAHELVLQELGLEPLLDNRIRSGEGSGAILATSIIKVAMSARTNIARTVKEEGGQR
jgi:nicotinate-nucleotide--dimethylbenzimidazole phosphoribosyltransferase